MRFILALPSRNLSSCFSRHGAPSYAGQPPLRGGRARCSHHSPRPSLRSRAVFEHDFRYDSSITNC